MNDSHRAKELNVLVFTAGNQHRPSSKYRAYLLGTYLQEADSGIHWNIIKPSTGELSALSYWRQITQTLVQARQVFFGNHDIIFAQRAIYNKFIFIVLMCNTLFRIKPLIFDIDDAVFVHGAPFKTKWLSKTATICLGGSEYVCRYMRRYNKQVLHMPTLIKFSDYDEAGALRKASDIPTIGWLGNGPAHADALGNLAPVLRALRESGLRFKFLLIGALTERDFFTKLFDFITEG